METKIEKHTTNINYTQITSNFIRREKNKINKYYINFLTFNKKSQKFQHDTFQALDNQQSQTTFFSNYKRKASTLIFLY
jgi:hypothetical protein